MNQLVIAQESFAPPRKRNRLWVIFFVLLALLSVVALIVPLVYNLSIQLRTEQLEAARRHWAETGPTDYDLWIEQRTTNAAGETRQDVFHVLVRGGTVVSPRQRSHSVEGCFDRMAANLAADGARTDRRNYATATFAPSDGHPTRYVHRTAGSKEREEWLIRLAQPGEP